MLGNQLAQDFCPMKREVWNFGISALLAFVPVLQLGLLGLVFPELVFAVAAGAYRLADRQVVAVVAFG
jgi:hypothetical protein